MLECLILGDSIAVGVGQHLSQCRTYAKVGITSHGWSNTWLQNGLDAKHTIISLGSNDSTLITGPTKSYLKSIRENLSGKVYWVLPANNDAVRSIIEEIAKKHGDIVFPIQETIRDGVHPTSREYRRLAEQTKP